MWNELNIWLHVMAENSQCHTEMFTNKHKNRQGSWYTATSCESKVVKGLGKADIFSMIFGFHLDKNIVYVFI